MIVTHESLQQVIGFVKCDFKKWPGIYDSIKYDDIYPYSAIWYLFHHIHRLPELPLVSGGTRFFVFVLFFVFVFCGGI